MSGRSHLIAISRAMGKKYKRTIMLYHCLCRSLLELNFLCLSLAKALIECLSNMCTEKGMKFISMISFCAIIRALASNMNKRQPFFAFFTLAVGVGRGWCHKKLWKCFINESKKLKIISLLKIRKKSWKKFSLFWQQQVFVSENNSEPALLTWRHSPPTSSCSSCVLHCVLHYFMRP